MCLSVARRAARHSQALPPTARREPGRVNVLQGEAQVSGESRRRWDPISRATLRPPSLLKHPHFQTSTHTHPHPFPHFQTSTHIHPHPVLHFQIYWAILHPWVVLFPYPPIGTGHPNPNPNISSWPVLCFPSASHQYLVVSPLLASSQPHLHSHPSSYLTQSVSCPSYLIPTHLSLSTPHQVTLHIFHILFLCSQPYSHTFLNMHTVNTEFYKWTKVLTHQTSFSNPSMNWNDWRRFVV